MISNDKRIGCRTIAQANVGNSLVVLDGRVVLIHDTWKDKTHNASFKTNNEARAVFISAIQDNEPGDLFRECFPDFCP